LQARCFHSKSTCDGKGSIKLETFQGCFEICDLQHGQSGTTKHRSKIIADASALIQQYLQTPEGNNKMSAHIKACVTMRADGDTQLLIVA
jgi:hypothetical protein